MDEIRRARLAANAPRPPAEETPPVVVAPRPGPLAQVSYWTGWVAADLAKTALAIVLASVVCLPILPLGAISVLPLLAVFFRLRGQVDGWLCRLSTSRAP